MAVVVVVVVGGSCFFRRVGMSGLMMDGVPGGRTAGLVLRLRGGFLGFVCGVAFVLLDPIRSNLVCYRLSARLSLSEIRRHNL